MCKKKNTPLNVFHEAFDVCNSSSSFSKKNYTVENVASLHFTPGYNLKMYVSNETLKENQHFFIQKAREKYMAAHKNGLRFASKFNNEILSMILFAKSIPNIPMFSFINSY